MKLKTSLTIIMMLINSVIIIAQENYSLTGTVVSAVDQMGIGGANVFVKGTSNGVTTDFDGNFTLNVKSGDVLSISFLGFLTQEIVITNQRSLSIVLAEDASALDEVVVIGYGTQKKSHVTGSVARVSGDDLAALQVNRVDDALAGKLEGVLIQNQDGSPGADPKIQVGAT